MAQELRILDIKQPKGKEKICGICQKAFITHPSNPNRNKTKYCSAECSKSAHQTRQLDKARQFNLSRRLNLNTGEIGQINEMLVAIKMIKEGYKIYMPFDTTCPHDLLAFKNGVYYKVQVKTGTFMGSGNKQTVKLKNNDYNLLAVVYNLGEEIEIIPNL